jgi:ADP-ribose pyrophosphatase YjhB (NUDIX family)
MRSLRYASIRVAMKLPAPIRRRLTWLTQATFTVGVSAVLLNDQHEILLLRHRFREHQNWELPGGFVEREESLIEALQRELSEETGLVVEILSLLSAGISRARHLDVCYLARVAGGSLRLDDQEILEAGFYAYQDLPPDLKAEQRRNIEPARDHLDQPAGR